MDGWMDGCFVFGVCCVVLCRDLALVGLRKSLVILVARDLIDTKIPCWAKEMSLGRLSSRSNPSAGFAFARWLT